MRVLAWEAKLLGGWLGDGLPSWGKVGTHLDWVNPFWGSSAWMEGLAKLSLSPGASGASPSLR